MTVQVTQGKWDRRTLPLASGEVAAYGETAIGDPATGTVKAGPSLATGLVLGIFNEAKDASSAQKDVDVNFLNEITVLWRENDGGITIADLFKPCYAVDKTKVSKTSTNRALFGTILGVDSVKGVAVAIGRPFLENT